METWCGTNTKTQRSDATQCLPSSLVPFPVFFPLPVQTAGFDIPEHYPLVAAHYGRHVYIRPTPHLDNVCDRCATHTFNLLILFHHSSCGCAVAQEALSASWDADSVMLDFFSSETGIVVIDDFLTPEALEELLAFTEESTIWHDDGPGEYGTDRRGYLGAYLNDGFGSGLLMQVSQCQAVPCMHTDACTCNTPSPAPQIAAELKQRLPDIFHNHSLHQAWAYKYNSTKVRGHSPAHCRCHPHTHHTCSLGPRVACFRAASMLTRTKQLYESTAVHVLRCEYPLT